MIGNVVTQVDLLLEENVFEKIWPYVESKLPQFTCSSVIMSLAELLEGDFFNRYIKVGKMILLLVNVSNLTRPRKILMRPPIPRQHSHDI